MERDLLHTKMVREIISLIASNGYCEGSHLPSERNLCKKFNTSRGTLRKALAELEKMEVINIKPKSGIYVKKLSQDKLHEKVLPRNFEDVCLKDIIVARKAIEVAAIEAASEKITEDEKQKLEEITNQMGKNINNLPLYLKLDMSFHEFVVGVSKNQALITAFESISEYHKYSQVFSSTYEECEEDSYKFHRKIFGALKKQDKKQAAQNLKAHFDNMLKKAV